ncbi:MAG TPA: right-handed parallel beta-helix repeat-containing protein, partial [Chloroflexota bacterium]|nr:right-handed parallel beta-helix repeat-containing protein [Chloroflexota bacterium]
MRWTASWVSLAALILVFSAPGARAAGRNARPQSRLALQVTPTPASIYVSPSGNDGNPGTQLLPLRTVSRARDVVRGINGDMAGDITIYLESGTYRLTSTVTLTPLDSGTNGYSVVWTAAPGAHPVLNGGDRITGWKLADASKNIWSATVPANLRTRQLYVNGTRATMASGVAPVALTKTSGGYVASSAVMAHWRNPSDIDFVFTGQVGRMTESVCPVASIRRTIITMAQPCWDNSTRRVADHVGYPSVYLPSYIENAYALLDSPGQFYLDYSAHKLYYIPRKGEDLQTADVEAPVLQTLVKGTGTPSNPIRNITFSGIAFSYSTWLQPGSPQGFSEMQAGYTLTGKNAYATEGLCRLVPHGTCPYGAWTKEPGSVLFAYALNVSFLNDRFVHLGSAGLNLDDGSQHDTVAQSVFTDISGNGIEIGNVDRPQAKGAVRTLGVIVTDNHLYSLPVEFHGGVAILIGYAARSLISHNQIDHVAYTAISIGWGGWLDKVGQPSVQNFSHDNVISDNLVYDFMQVVEDGGGIYTQG